MFDIGFGELVVVAVVALIVIGPERLPKVARVGGIIVGRLFRKVDQLKAELAQEFKKIDLDDE